MTIHELKSGGGIVIDSDERDGDVSITVTAAGPEASFPRAVRVELWPEEAIAVGVDMIRKAREVAP